MPPDYRRLNSRLQALDVLVASQAAVGRQSVSCQHHSVPVRRRQHQKSRFQLIFSWSRAKTRTYLIMSNLSDLYLISAKTSQGLSESRPILDATSIAVIAVDCINGTKGERARGYRGTACSCSTSTGALRTS